MSCRIPDVERLLLKRQVPYDSIQSFPTGFSFISSWLSNCNDPSLLFSQLSDQGVLEMTTALFAIWKALRELALTLVVGHNTVDSSACVPSINLSFGM